MRLVTALVVLLGAVWAAAPIPAQFGAKDEAAWANAPMRMAGIELQPEIAKVVVLNLAYDGARADHATLATAIPDALAEILVPQKLAQEAQRRARTFQLGDLGLPEFDSSDEVTKFAEEVGADAMVCGDVALVGDVTRVRLVVAELDRLMFYPPLCVYVTDPGAVQAVTDMACRALRSFLQAEDLQKQLKETWQEPEAGQLRFEARPNLSRVPAGQPCSVFVRFEFAAGKFEVGNRGPINVAVILDRSGSMEGEKIEQAKQAASRVIEGLQDTDRISFVIYNHEVETPVPNRKAEDRDGILSLIQGIVADGYTNLGGGLQQGYKQARKALDPEYVNRAILLSDGLANRGETDPGVLSEWARRQYQEDLSTSTIGIGTDYDANLMEKIAVAGNGGYYYVQSPESINDIIAREFTSLFATVADSPRLSIRPADGARLEYVVGFETKAQDGAQVVEVPTLRSSDRKYLIAKLSVPALTEGPHEVLQARIDFQEALEGGRPAKVETSLKLEAGGVPGPDAVNWDVQLDAEELATTDVMDAVVKRLDAEDRQGAVALLQARIMELAAISLQTLDLRSQVQCNILDGLIALIEQGTDAEGLRYARNNAQTISYGGLAANMNYQGLGRLRGAAAAPAAQAGGFGGGGFGGKRQQ
jgi:Ca-activated chloride channel family protein